MLTDREKAFLDYWKANRERKKNAAVRLREGLQPALLFALPVILLLIAVWLFFPEWQTKISKTSPSALIAALLALAMVVVFFAFFKTQYDWEKQEQQYRELRSKSHDENGNQDT